MRKSVGQAPTAGENAQQKPCRTSSDIGSRTGKSYCRTRSDVGSVRVKLREIHALAEEVFYLTLTPPLRIFLQANIRKVNVHH
jgi:hypothetical protein